MGLIFGALSSSFFSPDGGLEFVTREFTCFSLVFITHEKTMNIVSTMKEYFKNNVLYYYKNVIIYTNKTKYCPITSQNAINFFVRKDMKMYFALELNTNMRM